MSIDLSVFQEINARTWHRQSPSTHHDNRRRCWSGAGTVVCPYIRRRLLMHLGERHSNAFLRWWQRSAFLGRSWHPASQRQECEGSLPAVRPGRLSCGGYGFQRRRRPWASHDLSIVWGV